MGAAKVSGKEPIVRSRRRTDRGNVRRQIGSGPAKDWERTEVGREDQYTTDREEHAGVPRAAADSRSRACPARHETAVPSLWAATLGSSSSALCPIPSARSQ